MYQTMISRWWSVKSSLRCLVCVVAAGGTLFMLAVCLWSSSAVLSGRRGLSAGEHPDVSVAQQYVKNKSSMEFQTTAKTPVLAMADAGNFQLVTEGRDPVEKSQSKSAGSQHLRVTLESSVHPPTSSLRANKTDKVFPEIIVHLDFKGAPPKVTYLRKFFRLIRNLGATGVLIEWEDTFPYECIKNPAVGVRYSQDEVGKIIQSASAIGLTVIPLVQTFGHLEHALKLPEFASLRENPLIPQAICPKNEQALDLVFCLLDEVIDVVKKNSVSRQFDRIHLGMDEVFQLGQCPKCKGTGHMDLYTQHVKRVSDYVAAKHDGLKSIIWADMITKDIDSADIVGMAAYNDRLKTIGGVEPMFWWYPEKLPLPMSSANRWFKTAKFFSTAWVSTAFKGASVSAKLTPTLAHRLKNHLSWLDLGHRHGNLLRNGFAGMVITGWSRNDHFATLSELLPAGLPALAVSLALVGMLNSRKDYGRRRFTVQKDPHWLIEVGEQLNCSSLQKVADLSGAIFHESNDQQAYRAFSAYCGFPGAGVLESVLAFKTFLEQFNELRRAYFTDSGWLNGYNMERDFLHQGSCSGNCRDSVLQYNMVLRTLVRRGRRAFDEIYPSYVFEEYLEHWLGAEIKFISKLATLLQDPPSRAGSSCSGRSDDDNHKKVYFPTWPNRPFQPSKFMNDFLNATEN